MKPILFAVLTFLAYAVPSLTYAAEEVKSTPPSGAGSDNVISIPYGFYDDIFGAAVAWVYSIEGSPEPQSGFLATAMAGSKGSAMLFLMGHDIRVFGVERLFIDPIVSTGYFVDYNAYIDGNPGFPGQQAGSNESDKNNYVTGSGWDNYYRITFKYLLPIGNGKDQIVNAYRLKGGLLESGASGGTSWNPLESGRTFLQVRPFYRSQQIDSNYVYNVQRTNGLDFITYWDNRDFPVNPSRGESLLLKLGRDFGWANSSNAWSVYSAEFDQYFSLGQSDTFRHRVLAFDIWTAYSPSWQVQPDGTIANRPPTYAGATLGGLWRMRGFPDQRFSDKAGIYYGAEYRMVPYWNPFNDWPWLQQYIGIQWIQFVPFVEAGRVAPQWNFRELNSAMKWDAGFGFRAMAKGLVVRIDLAGSSEGASVVMMVNQPFQF
jgi:hypothetical protein